MDADARSLFGTFCAFYEQIAAMRLAQSQGHLPALLVQGDEAPPTTAEDMATRASAQLAGWLRADAALTRKTGTDAYIRVHKMAQYVMTALADEILLLELDWAGQRAWPAVLLEARLYRTRMAGERFFELQRRLLEVQRPAELHVELGMIMLAALQLGFRGMLRGDHLQRQLAQVQRRLLHFVARQRPAPDGEHAFAQAYTQRSTGSKDQRLAPLKPWWRSLTLALLGVGLLSMLIWLVMVQTGLAALNAAS
ncbi:DotU family type IV/VI secretion system protein [Andreprevotia sp. IGB-42]|uniref:DotU family type IV/VI secretion system protein n=1 Tax=Andreprevotia sp. IGB-42 TaxID=2497473 RepID=UPI00135913FA|nr:DotU family type IV/VI secretion system protein [Andreprevotia sp. IGB-42]